MRLLTITTGVVLLAVSAQALSPADKCEADKLKRAGKYSFCRLKADAKAVKIGGLPDYSLCDLTLGEKWTSAESGGGGQCPTNGDLASMQARITNDANDVAGCLSGACPPSCGDGTANGAESCDGSDLGGASCTSLGFGGGTLGCTGSCGFELTGCLPPSHHLLATGQTTSYGTGSDGDVHTGAPLSYTDNGDGTITDNNTGLTWEKKSFDGSIHDRFNTYSWGMTTPPYTMNGTIVTTFLDTLNDVSGGGLNCFAGYCDWRIPNRNELLSIVNIEHPAPSVSPAFNTGCGGGCTVLTCSCTDPSGYWSSSTYQDSPDYAWTVSYFGGDTGAFPKSATGSVRAVRGGS